MIIRDRSAGMGRIVAGGAAAASPVMLLPLLLTLLLAVVPQLAWCEYVPGKAFDRFITIWLENQVSEPLPVFTWSRAAVLKGQWSV
jgi:hypothetical protein